MLRERQIFKFGDYLLDPVAKVLFRNGEPVRLTRKAAETLLVLVENAGQVLTKEEIMHAVWTDRVVDEANLAQNIAVIRRTLGAVKGSPAHIETFPGRGYRLEGPVTSEVVAPAAPELVATASAPASAPAVTQAPSVEAAPVAVAAPEPIQARRHRRLAIGGFLLILLVVVILAVLNRPQARTPQPGFQVTPVTRLPGKEYQPSISPDGSRIAFLWTEDASRSPKVWLKELSENSPRELSHSEGHHSSPSWSPDGRSVAYLRTGRSATEVVVASASERHERVLTVLPHPNYGPDNRLLDWSPDGTLLTAAHSDAVGKPLGILLISLATGATRPLTEAVPDASGDVDPRFSPDGKSVTFIRLVDRFQHELFSVPVAGGKAKQLTRLGKRISSHDWMPDGKTIVFAYDRDGTFRLWRLDAGASDVNREMAPIGIYSEFPIQLSIAQAAGSLVYSALHQDRNIWRLDLRDRTWKRLLASSGQDASPQYSPAADRICFRSDRSGEEQLWVAGADGSNPVQITQGVTRPSVGRWSPDGRSIVFNSPHRGEIYIARASDTGWSVQNTGVRGVHPVFSPDGAWIYAGGQSAILRFPAGGGPAATVAQLKAEALAFGAGGRNLYFVREPNDTTVWSLAIDSGRTGVVLDSLVPGCTSCWALAADGIYYLGTSKESVDAQVLYFRPFARSSARAIVEYPEPLWPMGSGPFSLSADGRSLLCVRMDPSSSDVMLVSPL